MSDVNDYSLVRDEIAHFLGTPMGTWDARTAHDVASAIRKGINAVVHNVMGHQWSWMQPVYRVTTADGQRRYTLPADFEQFRDHIYFDGENYQHTPITQKPAARLHQLHSEYSGTGVPYNYALETPAHDGTTEQRQELVLHPTPDGTYMLVGVYQVGPIRSLSEDRPWFPGGPENRELFIAAALAQAEIIFMDSPQTSRQDQFKSELVAAISRDGRRGARNLGPMNGRQGKDYWRHKLRTMHEGHVDS
jgi:hypothetical protein